MKRILVIEDEKNLSRFIELELKYEGYDVGLAYDGRDGLEKSLEEEWDIILLDLMLPGLNGLEVCRRIRQVKSIPILMITARDSVMDRVSGLDSGADDYIVKPFAIEELLARLRAVFRRAIKEETVVTQTTFHFRDITVHKESRQVFKLEEEIEVTKREYDLLLAFLENKNIVLTREVLLNKVWGYDTEVETNVVDVYVRYLRNKIDSPGEDSYIQTVRGTGYVMRT
ncbi:MULTISPECIES: response regulator transcription factor [Bacillaceae]|uniref:response regulator transcription factor n=1 Tax=Bacillaceae TaxID=186817 RepID=UPI001C596BC0|nr:response regulator transcription factor [Rossellomorea sp. YZS02]MBW3113088.1 response regulator transcription factor [Bacillus sp. MCCB 382]MDX8343686.1 response regulator transcription factor [Rossellomorea sp. YZS02]